MKNLAIYIHIPFCKSKCFYCDFNSYANKDELIDSYFNSLYKEIGGFPQSDQYDISSIFIGGGTPSYVDEKYINKLLEIVKRKFSLKHNCEITIETNPGTINTSKATAYKEVGINRVSIGLQSAKDRLLKEIGRIHTYQEFKDSYFLFRECGFTNINVDLIFGLPGQTLNDWVETIESVVSLKPEHISCYSLKVEKGTKLEKMLNKKEGSKSQECHTTIDEEVEREMYHYARKYFQKQKYKQYEISNFSFAGYKSIQNLTYWNCEEYIGFGPGAHSYIDNYRYENISGLENYCDEISQNKKVIKNRKRININEQISEYLILGLRKIEGVNKSNFEKKYGFAIDDKYEKIIDDLVRKKLVRNDKKNIRLTAKGLDFANVAMVEFIE